MKGKSSEGKAGVPGTQAIDRALDVLGCFMTRPECGITDLAKIVGLSPSTAHRIVQALVARGYLEQSASTERYHLGPAALVLGQSARAGLGLERVLPMLEALGTETGESVNLGMRDGNHVTVVMQVESTQQLRFDQPVGSRRLLQASSMGKSLLAFESDEDTPFQMDDLHWEAVTPKTIVDPNALNAELREVRDLGYSVDAEESLLGVSCMGAPVLNGAGQAIAAIAVQGPTARMATVDQSELGQKLMKTAAEISQVLRLEILETSPI